MLLIACQLGQESDAYPLETGTPAPASREPWLWPFAEDSPWNLPVGTELSLAKGECSDAVTDPSVDAWVNAETWSHPVFRAEVEDPLLDVWEDGTVVEHIATPANAVPSLPAWPDGDAHLHLISPDGTAVTEMWKARLHTEGGWEVDSVQVNDLRGPGIGTGGVRIYGGSAFGGLWRVGESEAGAGHALALSLPLAALAPTSVWPATSLDTSREDVMTGVVPIGQHVALPANVDIDRFSSPEARSLARSLRDYGAYVVDHASGFALYAEPNAANEADHMRDDIDAIRAALQCSMNNTADTPGGPGDRVKPPAPAFSID